MVLEPGKDYLELVAQREQLQNRLVNANVDLNTCREATKSLRQSNHEMGAKIDRLTSEAQTAVDNKALQAVALKNANDQCVAYKRTIAGLEDDIKVTYAAKRAAVDAGNGLVEQIEVIEAERHSWKIAACVLSVGFWGMVGYNLIF